MKALKLRTTVGRNGSLRLQQLPLREGTEVEVIILEPEEGEDELLRAAETTLSFWDNPIDDEMWNDA